MKNIFSYGSILLTVVLAGTFPANVSAQDAPVAEWANLFDGKTSAGDQAESVSVAKDGNVYWHLMGGTNHTERDIYYAGSVLFEGADYNPDQNSQTNNLCVLKTDARGNRLWDFHTLTHDFANNDGAAVATSDGGVVLSGRLRHSDGFLDSDFRFVDGTGKEHTVAWTADRRYYRGFVARLAADGSLLWYRFVDCSTDPVADSEFVPEAFTMPALTVDNDDNVYVGGNFRTVMTLDGADGTVSLTPNHTAGWNGDPQGSVGSLYLLKLGGTDGKCLASATDSGEASMTKVDRLVWAEGHLFANSLVMGTGSEVSMFGKSFIPEGDFTPVLASLDTDLRANWVAPYKGEKMSGKYGFQNCGVTVCGDNLWFTGQVNGTITDPVSGIVFSTTQANLREGMLVKVNATDGTWVKAVNSRESFPGNVLTGYLAAFQNPEKDSRVYVFGYGMNATVGTFLRTYDAVTLEGVVDRSWNLVTGGGAPTCQACAYDPNASALYATTRGNKAFTPLGGTETAAPAGWAILLTGFGLPRDDFYSGVDAVSFVGEETVSILPVAGGIRAEGSSAEAVAVYNVAGIRVGVIPPFEGEYTLTLPSGLYIAGSRRLIVR